MNPFDRQAPIPGIKKIIVVGSGKGGVGKSTVAVNLALALKEEGKTVGLLDADIYGPSLPRLIGALQQKPDFHQAGKIAPLIRYGMRLMSMGFIVSENQAVVWRGPMLFKAFEQFFRDVQWGDLDYLIIDLPPGTGDVPLTIAQKVPVAGAVIVSTPQNLALVDAKKAIDMMDQIKIPIIGVVENMAYMQMPGSDEKIQLFPRGDLDQYLDAKNISKLGEIPFDTKIGLTTEAGMPIVMAEPKSATAENFRMIAKKLIGNN
jgi:ATP-binding protein involved in chromosome partitioning